MLVNDDGVGSVGLELAKETLKKLVKLAWVAPFNPKSGMGKALTLTKPIKVVKINDGFCVDGTPADCVLLALYKLLKFRPDLVVSGINLGPNLGLEDYLNSGTIGAALEAALHEIPSIAVSYCDVKVRSKVAFKAASFVLEHTVNYVFRNGMPPKVKIISINVPSKLKKVEAVFAEIADTVYKDIFREAWENIYTLKSWRMDFYEGEPGTDVYVIKREGKIAVTGLDLNFHAVKKTNSLVDYLNEKLKHFSLQ